MPSSLPLFIVCAVHGAYAAVVTSLWAVGGPVPPPQLNSLVVATAAVSAVAVTRRCGCRGEVDALRAEVAELREQVRQLARVPQRVYIGAAVAKPFAGQRAATDDAQGLGPAAIEAAKEINRRLNGLPEP